MQGEVRKQRSTRSSFVGRKSESVTNIEKISRLTSALLFPRQFDFYSVLLKACDKELTTLTIPETLLQEESTGEWVCIYSDSNGTVRSVRGQQ